MPSNSQIADFEAICGVFIVQREGWGGGVYAVEGGMQVYLNGLPRSLDEIAFFSSFFFSLFSLFSFFFFGSSFILDFFRGPSSCLEGEGKGVNNFQHYTSLSKEGPSPEYAVHMRREY